MTFNEYCEYIGNPLADPIARLVIIPSGEYWTALRRFHQERDGVELRLSDLVRENSWLAMPDEIFSRVNDAMTGMALNGKTVILLGMPGYLALLTDDNKRAAVVALREWIDDASELNAVCLLRSDDCSGTALKEVFTNPRYRQRKQLIEIEDPTIEKSSSSLWSSSAEMAPEDAEGFPVLTEVMLIDDELATLIPSACDTFRNYLRYVEEYPYDTSNRRIVVASRGQELAGLSAEVRQVVSLRDFARVIHNVEAEDLSETTLRWMCEQGKEAPYKAISEVLKLRFFPIEEMKKSILLVFDRCKSVEREALLWLVRDTAPKGSYLDSVIHQDGVTVNNFRSAYLIAASAFLDEFEMYARERSDAILEADVALSCTDIRQFIVHTSTEATSRVAPWLNCGTKEERVEMLRRCSVDGVVLKAVKDVYPEVAAYLSAEKVYSDAKQEIYFKEYRELKLAGNITPDFFRKAEQMPLLSSVQSRDSIVQRYASDSGCAMLVVDAMGAEWLPMLVAMARERNLGIESVAVGEARLPTMTQFNSIYWPDTARRLPDMKRFDNIAHNGVEMHETRPAEENMATELDVIGSELFHRVEIGLVRFKRVLVTADHGSSRLAALAWQSEPKLARTLACEEGAEIADWRYRERAAHGDCPPELEETLDGKYWVVRGYDRLPKKGGGQGFELHGGATLEERLVPVVVFSLTGQFIPMAKAGEKRAQIVENDDFDL